MLERASTQASPFFIPERETGQISGPFELIGTPRVELLDSLQCCASREFGGRQTVASTESILIIAGVAAEALAFSLLIFRRAYRTLPVFTSYLAWSLLNDLSYTTVTRKFPSAALLIYLVSTSIDALFQFGVLFELSRSVLRPAAKFLPRWTSYAVAGLIILICAAIWPFTQSSFTQSTVFAAFNRQQRLLVHLQQTFSILRVLFFLVLAGCSQLLSIGWKDRELQIATGLGFYSMVSLAVSVLHTRVALYPQYVLMDRIVVASYVCSLLYWVFCFAQQEAERREFTPQMQSFLLAVAGTARTTRMSMMDSAPPKDRDRRE